MKQFVEKVFDDGLCCSCGVCIGICSANAITYSTSKNGYLKPIIDYNKCCSCGQCKKYCPGDEFKTTLDVSSGVDKYQYVVGYSKNNEIRKDAASGGLTTELLKYLLTSKTVDKVSVIPSVKNIEQVHPILTDDIDVVCAAKSSKYCPVPIGEILSKMKPEMRYAIVCVPCQAQAIREYANSKKIKIIIVTLFCNHCSSYNATKYMVYGLNMKQDALVLYRGDGWPGYIKIEDESAIVKMPLRDVYLKSFGKFFYTFRCRICNDPFGVMGDISMADAFVNDKRENGDGKTFAIVRNNAIMMHLNEMFKNGQIELEKFDDIARYKTSFKSQFLRTKNTVINMQIRTVLCGKRKILPLKFEEVISNAEENYHYKFKNILRYIRDEVQSSLYGGNKFTWKHLWKIKQKNTPVTKKIK